MIITGVFAAACLIFTAIICRIAFRLGNKPMQRLWVQRLRVRCAWAFNFVPSGRSVAGWSSPTAGAWGARTRTGS